MLLGLFRKWISELRRTNCRISTLPERLVLDGNSGETHADCAREDPLFLLPAMANRHGLVAGATGTGKTVTLQVMSEQFSAIGVPVFAVDIKGDLSGISQPGVDSPKIAERVASLKLTDFKLRGSPVVFWDVFGI
jgi:hypothetical protein